MNQFKCGYISSSVWIGPGGRTILPCCYTSKQNSAGYSDLEYDSIINHPVLQEIRKAAINGEAHELCENCVIKEQHGLKSPRHKANENFSNQGEVKVEIDYLDLEQVYLSLSNVCNYKCVICSPGQSHLIAKEEKLSNHLHMVNDTEFDDFITLIKEAKNLKFLQLTGGEPFQHKVRLKRILENVQKDIKFYLHTNGSIFDEQLIKMMEDFTQAQVAFSIDGHKNSFEYQRTNGVWDEVYENIKQFNSKIDTTKVEPVNNYTVTCFNLLDIKDFIENYHPYFGALAFHELKNPHMYNINVLKTEVLEQFQDELTTYYDNLPDEIESKINLKEIWVSIQTAIDNPARDETIDAFWNRAEYMDKVRGISLTEKLPHLLDYIRTV